MCKKKKTFPINKIILYIRLLEEKKPHKLNGEKNSFNYGFIDLLAYTGRPTVYDLLTVEWKKNSRYILSYNRLNYPAVYSERVIFFYLRIYNAWTRWGSQNI